MPKVEEVCVGVCMTLLNYRFSMRQTSGTPPLAHAQQVPSRDGRCQVVCIIQDDEVIAALLTLCLIRVTLIDGGDSCQADEILMVETLVSHTQDGNRLYSGLQSAIPLVVMSSTPMRGKDQNVPSSFLYLSHPPMLKH